ncbi:hypothetical protein LIHA111178_11000 [Litorimonas haliclonae]
MRIYQKNPNRGHNLPKIGARRAALGGDDLLLERKLGIHPTIYREGLTVTFRSTHRRTRTKWVEPP